VDLTESGYLDLGTDGSLPSIQTLKSMPPVPGTKAAAPAPRPGVPKAAVIGMLAAAVAVAAFLATRPEEVPQAVANAPDRPAAQTAAETAQQEQRDNPNMLQRVSTVHVKIDVWPTNARVTLDGAILPRVPFDAEVAKDTAFHHLDVTAEGYAPVKQALQFDQDREVKIVLEREQAVVAPTPPFRRGRGNNANNNNNNNNNNAAAVAPPQPQQPSPVAQPAPAADPTPGADLSNTAAPRRMRPSIDLDDPYNQK